jgi:hypothetical protein
VNADPSIEAVLPALKRRRSEAVERIRDGQQEVRLLDLAIEGLEGLVPGSNGVREGRVARGQGTQVRISGGGRVVAVGQRGSPSKLRAIDAIAQAVRSSVEGLTLPELTEQVAALGFRPDSDQPERAVRASANRLRERNPDFDFVGKRYIYRPDHADLPEGGGP